jgi:hypothetical protein
MNRAELQELMPLVVLGMATNEERALVQAALETDPALRLEYADLERVLSGIAHAQAVEPPPGFKAKLLEAARADATRQAGQKSPIRLPLRWVAAGLGLAATVAALLVMRPATTNVNATALGSTSDGGLVYANSGRAARVSPAVLVRATGEVVPIRLETDRECQFTAVVSSAGLTYLLDSGNDKVFIVREDTAEVIDRWVVPPGATELAVRGDTVAVSNAKTMLIFRLNQNGEKIMVEARLSAAGQSLSAKNADAAIIEDGRIYITDRKNGLVRVLSEQDGREVAQFSAARAPVSLATRAGALWTLDAAGALFKLQASDGTVLERVELEGTPELLTLTDDTAFVADREGFLTAIRLSDLQITIRKRLQKMPMDLQSMPDGHVAVALAQDGVRVFDQNLDLVQSLP